MTNNKTRLKNRLLVILLLLAPLALGCGQATETTSEPAEPPVSTVEQGPVRVTAEVTAGEVSLSDRPKLVVTIDHEPNVEVKMLPFGERIGEFRILEENDALPQVKENRDVVRRSFTLEPLTTGRQEVWPVMVDYVDHRPGSDPQTYTIETKPLFVTVTSVIQSDNPVLNELRRSEDLQRLPFSYMLFIIGAGVGFMIVLIGAGLWIWYRRRQQIIMARALTPTDLAAQELDALVTSGLAEHDVKEFYVGLTGIVRRFIERTTGIRAPEQTTEEFLREVSQRDSFDPNENRRLKSFLESGDLVKFAAYMPENDAITNSIDRARVFVGLQQEVIEELEPIQ
ncbi:MAG: hypothetical protein PVH19_03020 [Planctomycetia bacterium]